MNWNDPDVCDTFHSIRWKWWAVFSALRLAAYSLIVLLMQVYRPFFQERPEYHLKAVNLKNTIDAFALIWFVVGNMWIFGDDDVRLDFPSLLYTTFGVI